MTVDCDSVPVVDKGREGSTPYSSSTSLFSLILRFLGKGCLIKVLLAFFSSASYPKFKGGTEFAP